MWPSAAKRSSADRLASRHLEIFFESDRKLELARKTEKLNDNP
jgi:hypothetical protein